MNEASVRHGRPCPHSPRRKRQRPPLRPRHLYPLVWHPPRPEAVNPPSPHCPPFTTTAPTPLPTQDTFSSSSSSQSYSTSSLSPFHEAATIASGNVRGPGVAMIRPRVGLPSPSCSASRSASPFPLVLGRDDVKGGVTWVQPSSRGRSKGTSYKASRRAFDGARVQSFTPGSLTEVDLRPLFVDDGVPPLPANAPAIETGAQGVVLLEEVRRKLQNERFARDVDTNGMEIWGWCAEGIEYCGECWCGSRHSSTIPDFDYDEERPPCGRFQVGFLDWDRVGWSRENANCMRLMVPGQVWRRAGR